jgi:hypothetical protein
MNKTLDLDTKNNLVYAGGVIFILFVVLLTMLFLACMVAITFTLANEKLTILPVPLRIIVIFLIDMGMIANYGLITYILGPKIFKKFENWVYHLGESS